MATRSAQPTSRSKTELLREKKIQECRQRISEDQKTIAVINSQRDRMCEVDIISIPVRHKLFGAGTITEQNSVSITVSFDFGSKRFAMPSAFLDGFLNTEDTVINEHLSAYLCLERQIQDAKKDISAANHVIRILEAKR